MTNLADTATRDPLRPSASEPSASETAPDAVQAMLMPSDDPPKMTDAQTEQVQALYDSLSEQAAIAYVTYFLAHTPPEFQDAMKGLITPPEYTASVPSAPSAA